MFAKTLEKLGKITLGAIVTTCLTLLPSYVSSKNVSVVPIVNGSYGFSSTSDNGFRSNQTFGSTDLQDISEGVEKTEVSNVKSNNRVWVGFPKGISLEGFVSYEGSSGDFSRELRRGLEIYPGIQSFDESGNIKLSTMEFGGKILKSLNLGDIVVYLGIGASKSNQTQKEDLIQERSVYSTGSLLAKLKEERTLNIENAYLDLPIALRFGKKVITDISAVYKIGIGGDGEFREITEVLEGGIGTFDRERINSYSVDSSGLELMFTTGIPMRNMMTVGINGRMKLGENEINQTNTNSVVYPKENDQEIDQKLTSYVFGPFVSQRIGKFTVRLNCGWQNNSEEQAGNVCLKRSHSGMFIATQGHYIF